MNLGKKFERQWKISADNQEVFCLRLNDSDLSFNQNKELRSRFTMQNPCDFIMFNQGNLFALELKSTHLKSIGIQREPKDNGMIKLHQINSLLHFRQYEGVISGFILNYRDDENIRNEKTYFLDIIDFNKFLCDSEKKSINQNDVILYNGLLINQTIKRTLYTYDVKGILDRLVEKEKNMKNI